MGIMETKVERKRENEELMGMVLFIPFSNQARKGSGEVGSSKEKRKKEKEGVGRSKGKWR